MVLPDQALDVRRTQLNLIAFGLTQPRRAERPRIRLRLYLFRKFFEQFVTRHHPLLRINPRRESRLPRQPLYSPQ
jgi:hypothetical protein